MHANLNVQMTGRLMITDEDTGAIVLDAHNAIHPQNMSRILSRGLARESNCYIHRMAFGNGGTVTDPAGTIIFNAPNDGRDGSWESRLYNETYSEVVDNLSINFGRDLGSAEPGNIRTGGGAVTDDDPEDGGVRSQEVGARSNVIISLVINKNEPTGQLRSIDDFGVAISDSESTFIFDEIGLYSPGAPAAATNGFASVNVGNKTSEDVSLLIPSTAYTMRYKIDGVNKTTNILTPSGGSGPSGALTYGDLAEGLNTGGWINGGNTFNDGAFIFITDRTSGIRYPSIAGKESYGFLTVQSKSSGAASSVELICDAESSTDIFRALTNNLCNNVNVNRTQGQAAGVVNDILDPTRERERLLTHLVFPPITKTADKALRIVYTLTVSVAKTSDSKVNQILP